MSHYIISGVAGFIAGRVAEMLLDSGHSVVGVDDLNDAYDVRLKEYRLKRLTERSGFTFQQIDISNKQNLDMAIEAFYENQAGASFDAIINLAARAGVRQSLENPWVYLDSNVTGTLNLLEICRRFSIPKFILASTSSIYGAHAPLPTPETAESDHPLQPYAASKKAAEVLCHAYHYLYGIDVSVLRYFTVYGPAGRPDMVMFRFTQWISEGRPVLVNGDGEQSRGFTYVDDIARGTILALRPLGYEIINLGGHESIKINRLIEMLETVIDRKAQIRYQTAHPADMLANWADVEKAREILGWEPLISIEKGVANLVAWYNKERLWASQVRTM